MYSISAHNLPQENVIDKIERWPIETYLVELASQVQQLLFTPVVPIWLIVNIGSRWSSGTEG
jgi:hypothetical protein